MVKRDTIGTICRRVLKIFFCVYCLWHIIELCTMKGNIINAFIPVETFVFSLISSALFTVLVRNWIKINPPSLLLFEIEIAAAVLGFFIGKWIGKVLMVIAVGALVGSVLLFVGSMLLLVGLGFEVTKDRTKSLFQKAQTGTLTKNERDEFLRNVDKNEVPEEYKDSIEFDRIVDEQRTKKNRR